MTVAHEHFTDAKDLVCIEKPFELHIYSSDVTRQRTQGYVMCTLQCGTFSHTGDGGYINWAFEGAYTRLDKQGQPNPHGSVLRFEQLDKGIFIHS